MCDFIRKGNALISFYFHIPFPEELEDEVWFEKWKQIQWLADKGILGTKTGSENEHI